MSEKDELRLRYEAKKKDLESQLAQAKADASSAHNDEQEKLEERLKELQQSATETWEDMSEQAAKKMNDLLERFENR